MSATEKRKKIKELLKEKNAILLAHYYQRDEIQDIADILGDSLALSIEAARTDADIIVFAGVLFMAESAAILSPDKTVPLPVLDAGCPLADKITAAELNTIKDENPGARVVTYVNSSAQTKALSDICCTSANAVQVVNSLTDAETVIMAPDGNLARYTARFTDKKIIPWKGFCYVHDNLSPEAVRKVRDEHPKALFVAHPECRLEVLDLADFVGSTGAILEFARETDAGEIIVGTEKGIMHQLKKKRKKKTFIPASETMVCQDMKKISLDDILSSLEEMKHIIEVPEDVRIPAQRALKKMLEIS
ncbi:MAG: quinolinate synthase NadA [Deltaproteobacteria bacterium]|nr:quinolinate synthase NadA [Deltaproteobacteria bacterium]